MTEDKDKKIEEAPGAIAVEPEVRSRCRRGDTDGDDLGRRHTPLDEAIIDEAAGLGDRDGSRHRRRALSQGLHLADDGTAKRRTSAPRKRESRI